MIDKVTQKAAEATANKPLVLLLYYSFSGQTAGLLNNFAGGLRQQGVEVNFVKLRPGKPLRFPVGTFIATFWMMLTTFLRFRVRISEPEPLVWEDYDLVILAGPTWSYNPSGPVLDFIDRFGPRLFNNKNVLPIISCRGYWRMHWYGLRRLLLKCGATVPNRIVFSHPAPEPWRTLGVFLKIAGQAPERSRFIGRHYKRYGHSKEQLLEAERLGAIVGQCLEVGGSLEDLDLHSTIALP